MASRRKWIVAGMMLSMVLVAAGAVLVWQSEAQAAPDWLVGFDKLSRQFSAELIAHGRMVPMDPPRRMAFYQPKQSDLCAVTAGAIYSFTINGSPEVLMAIENSGDPKAPTTYIEITRLSGWGAKVYRQGNLVADFPQTGSVRGAYVGLTR